MAEREGCPAERAREQVEGIFAALRDAIAPDEFGDIISELTAAMRRCCHRTRRYCPRRPRAACAAGGFLAPGGVAQVGRDE